MSPSKIEVAVLAVGMPVDVLLASAWFMLKIGSVFGPIETTLLLPEPGD